MEQDPGLPRAGHPRRHLAGSSLIEYHDDGNAFGGADNDDKVMSAMPMMLNVKHAGARCVREKD